MQTVGGRPSPDIFLGCEEEEASLVVVPLQLGPDTPYRAGLYLISDQKGNFATAKRPIVNLTSMLQLVVQKQLQEGGLLTKVWEDESIQKKVQEKGSWAACSLILPALRCLQRMSMRLAIAGVLDGVFAASCFCCAGTLLTWHCGATPSSLLSGVVAGNN